MRDLGRSDRTAIAASVSALFVGVAAAIAGECSVPFFLQAVGPNGSPNAHISRNNSGGAAYANRRIADDFTLTSADELGVIRFWGGDETDMPVPPNANIVAFNFRLYAANGPGGGPGTTLWEVARTMASDVTRTPTGFTVGALNAPEFEYRVEVVPPLQLPAGTYFLSIGAYHYSNLIDEDTETWQWSVAPGPGNGVIAEDRFNFQGMLLRNDITGTNMAFSLERLTEEASCAGDVDGDFDVDLNDLTSVLLLFGTANANGDVTGDGFVDLQDLTTVLLHFGSICTPC